MKSAGISRSCMSMNMMMCTMCTVMCCGMPGTRQDRTLLLL